MAERPRCGYRTAWRARVVGTIPAAALLTKAPGDNNAQYESALAFPLCRGLFATAKFSLLGPVSEYGSGPSDTFLVDGVPARSGTTTARWRRSRRSRSKGTSRSAA